MNLPTAVFAGFALIAAAVFLTGGAPAIGQTDDAGNWGPWNFKGIDSTDGVYLLNSRTGEIYLCGEKACGKLKIE